MLELQPSRLPSLGPGRPSGPGLGGAGGWTDGRREEDSAAPRRSGRGAGAAAPLHRRDRTGEPGAPNPGPALRLARAGSEGPHSAKGGRHGKGQLRLEHGFNAI